MKQNIQKKLIKMYQSVPKIPDYEKINSIIQEAKIPKQVIPRESSLSWFVTTQIRFINFKVWLFQILLLSLYAFFVFVNLRDTKGFLLLIPATPILVFIGTSELSRSFRYRMAELEMPTRFSLRHILLARLIIISALDLFTLTCFMIITSLQTYTAIHTLVLYGIVPCFVTAHGCLFILNRCNSSYSQYYTSTYSITLSVVGSLSVKLWPAWYDASARGIWLFVFCMALAGVCSEVYKMLHNCSQKVACFH